MKALSWAQKKRSRKKKRWGSTRWPTISAQKVAGAARKTGVFEGAQTVPKKGRKAREKEGGKDGGRDGVPLVHLSPVGKSGFVNRLERRRPGWTPSTNAACLPGTRAELPSLRSSNTDWSGTCESFHRRFVAVPPRSDSAHICTHPEDTKGLEGPGGSGINLGRRQQLRLISVFSIHAPSH